MTTVTFRSVRIIQYQVQAQPKLAGTAMNYSSSDFQDWKTPSPKNNFKVILQQMGELLELRARSGTAEKYSVEHIAAGRCRRQCHKSLCQHHPKLLIKMRTSDSLLSLYHH